MSLLYMCLVLKDVTMVSVNEPDNNRQNVNLFVVIRTQRTDNTSMTSVDMKRQDTHWHGQKSGLVVAVPSCRD